jgi:hypothetical protein
MRELWVTGWMQQSVRMAAANFLTEACGAPPSLPCFHGSCHPPVTPTYSRRVMGGMGATYSDAKVANRNVRDFRWEIAHEAVSRRPPISLHTIVARTRMYTYDTNVWALSIVQGPLSVVPRAKPWRYDSQHLHRCAQSVSIPPAASAWACLPLPTRGNSQNLSCSNRGCALGCAVQRPSP